MQQDVLQQGINLMIFGMGTVFVFLTLLVFSTSIMSSLVARFFPDRPEAAPVKPVPVATSNVTDPKLLAIIKAAVDQHRDKHNR